MKIHWAFHLNMYPALRYFRDGGQQVVDVEVALFEGHGLCLIDPHGELADRALLAYPAPIVLGADP
jgi:hypothetical protein